METIKFGNKLITSALLSSDGKSFAVTYEHSLEIFDASCDASHGIVKFTKSGPCVLNSFERDSDTWEIRIFALLHDNFLWELDTKRYEDKKTKLEIEDGFSPLNGGSVSPDRKKIAASSVMNNSHVSGLRVWSTENGKCLFKLEGHTGFISCPCWSPDGSSIITACIEGKMIIWNARDDPGKILHQIELGAPIFSASWSHDGTKFFSGCKPNGVICGNLPEGKRVSLKKASGSVFYSAWSPDQKMLCTTSILGEVHIWDSVDGELLFDLAGHFGPVMFCAWSSDGSRLMTMSKDKTVRLWAIPTGKIIQ